MNKYLPLMFSLIYLYGSLAVFAFGPFEYPINNPFQLYAYVISAYILFAAGYVLAIRKTTPFTKLNIRRSVNAKVVNSVLLISCLWSLAFAYPTYKALSGDKIDSLRGITNPGEAYVDKQLALTESSGEKYLPMQIKTLTAVLGIFFVPIAICFWNVVKWHNRLITILGALAVTLPWLFVGTLKGLGDFLIMMLVAYSVKAVRSRTVVLSKAFLIPVVVSIALFFVYMGWNQVSRLKHYKRDAYTINTEYYTYFGVPIIRDYFPETSSAISSILFYPSHGYAALDGCLSMPFKWTYGVGNSRAACSWLEQYLHIDNPEQQNYVFRYEGSINKPPLRFWSTVFPWFASDLTFGGTLFMMVFIGFGFAKCWCWSVLRGDILAIATLCQIGIFIAFVPCNNQLLQGRAGFCTIVALIGIWLVHYFSLIVAAKPSLGKATSG